MRSVYKKITTIGARWRALGGPYTRVVQAPQLAFPKGLEGFYKKAHPEPK